LSTIAFEQANATKLPFADGAFDLVLSQQMLQFVPDRLAALREIRRVLAPRGRLIASVWRPRNEQTMYEELGRIAERHLGPAKDPRFSLDGPTLRASLLEAGFTGIRIELATLTDRFTEFPVRQSALATADVSGLSDAERESKLDAVEADSKEVIARLTSDGAFGAPSFADVVIAQTA
jgi:SAM-dependent methyltransferase